MELWSRDDDAIVELDVVDHRRSYAGHTIYRIVLKVFTASTEPVKIDEVFVWRRYNEIKRLHKELKAINLQSDVSASFPEFIKAKIFGRFEERIIEERQQSAAAFLNYVAKQPVLWKSQALRKFFEGAVRCNSQPTTPVPSDEPFYLYDRSDRLSLSGDTMETSSEVDVAEEELEQVQQNSAPVTWNNRQPTPDPFDSNTNSDAVARTDAIPSSGYQADTGAVANDSSIVVDDSSNRILNANEIGNADAIAGIMPVIEPVDVEDAPVLQYLPSQSTVADSVLNEAVCEKEAVDLCDENEDEVFGAEERGDEDESQWLRNAISVCSEGDDIEQLASEADAIPDICALPGSPSCRKKGNNCIDDSAEYQRMPYLPNNEDEAINDDLNKELCGLPVIPSTYHEAQNEASSQNYCANVDDITDNSDIASLSQVPEKIADSTHFADKGCTISDESLLKNVHNTDSRVVPNDEKCSFDSSLDNTSGNQTSTECVNDQVIPSDRAEMELTEKENHPNAIETRRDYPLGEFRSIGGNRKQCSKDAHIEPLNVKDDVPLKPGSKSCILSENGTEGGKKFSLSLDERMKKHIQKAIENDDYVYQASLAMSEAIEREEQKKFHASFELYKLGIGLLLQGVQQDTDETRRIAVRRKTAQYLLRAENVYRQCVNESKRIANARKSKINLAEVRTIGIVDKAILVERLDTGEVFALKVLHKCGAEYKNRKDIRTGGNRKFIESKYMVGLCHFTESSTGIYIFLEYISGGLLWSHLDMDLSWNSLSTNVDENANKGSSGQKLLSVEQVRNIYDGTNLEGKNEGKSEDWIRKWIAEIVSVLGDLHKHGIICKDLNPRNILLDDEGHIKLTYFSNIRGVEYSLDENAVKRSYAAPEANGVFPLTEAADWWSVGAILFELLTRKSLHSCYPNGIHSHSIINLPMPVSNEAWSLLAGLLRFNSKDRLGSGAAGCEEIKSHPFFASINWTDL